MILLHQTKGPPYRVVFLCFFSSITRRGLLNIKPMNDRPYRTRSDSEPYPALLVTQTRKALFQLQEIDHTLYCITLHCYSKALGPYTLRVTTQREAPKFDKDTTSP